ncbi:snRNA-activating protein complex subunit 4 [Manduca sexta]|uniref:snRNA-activating protein complex subunit 4 n=1 Tax=Manduca sexta TaxID=7130 RepID=UPI0018902820|nr:snRNA-activating protein complex subunit 4 [Manduca sexta]
MDSDFESEDNSDVELEELNQLNAVLNADEPSTSSRVIPSIASLGSSRPATNVTEQLAKIDIAIAFNKETDEKLRRLEHILTNRLAECQKKLKTLSDKGTSNERHESFRYFYCGKPYFKDKYNFPAPDNEDTIIMAKSQMYDFSQVGSVPGWTVRDKSQFIAELHKMSQKIRKDELHAKMSQLRRENKIKKDKKIDTLIAGISREICKLKDKQLNEIALPLDREYDWETLANRLNRRHIPQEYESLWKLFFHPSVNKNAWTKTEHVTLQKIATDNNLQDWDDIAQKLGTGRTGYQCFVYYRTNMTNQFNGKKWSQEEIEYLRRLVDYYKEDNYIPWGKVAASMENRTKIQIYNKYTRLIGHRKGRFLPEEDAVILNSAAKFGENFQKMLAFLPGRSIIQIRNRYQTLTKVTVSMVWTEAEDRKLLQLMANQDSNVTFSSISHFFPGKDRIHIRSRYMTLLKWMRRNPNMDLAHAPRRAARRLTHGKPTENLNKAVENLKTRMETVVNMKKSSKLTEDSPEAHIDDAIVATLYNELIKEMEHKQCEETEKQMQPEIPGANINITNLRKVLIFLNADLDKDTYIASAYSENYPGLDASEDKTLCKLKSYSKNNNTSNLQNAAAPDVWGNNSLGTINTVLPPHYATITGCRALMAITNGSNKLSEDGVHIHVLLKRNPTLRVQFNLLMERFHTLFIWPMLLSNERPNEATILENTMREAKLRQANSSASSISTIVPSIPSIHIPTKYSTKKNKEEIENMKEIDLTNESEIENVTIKEDFADHHFMDFNYE